MNIGFDGKRAANNLTGLGNYSRSLISQLASKFPENQYFVFTPGLKNQTQIDKFFKPVNISLILPDNPSPWWRTLGIRKQLIDNKIDLFHGLSHEIPIGLNGIKIPSIVTIHDLIFLLFPKHFNLIDRFIYKKKIEYACKYADKIVAISEQTKQDIIRFFNVSSDKIEVVYQSCDNIFKTKVSDSTKAAIKSKYQLPDNFILNVGTIELRKNLIAVIRALPHIHQQYKLVVIGKDTAYTNLVRQEIENLSLQNRVIFLKNVPFNDLPAVYQLADTFVYPSIYEGFGIPIIEALYSALPVVAAIGSCLEEAGGENSIYVDPYNSLGFAIAINTILDNGVLKDKMITAGLHYAQKFNDELISAQMMSLYKKVVNN
ncbi:glycosyltransferase involved in cell wall biosynthesis [Pedobacter sp. UYP24]